LTGRNPTDRGKPGSKYHLLCDANGLPLHALISAANTHDSKLFEPLLDTNPGVSRRRGRRGRPQRRPEKVHADKGYDFPRCRSYLRRRGIKVRIARRGMDSSTKLGRHRWVVQRTISWLLRFKRLALRYDRTERTMVPLLILGMVLINLRRLVEKEF
jgi:transposase